MTDLRFREQLFPQWVWRLPAGIGRVALTFDDGPHPLSTPGLLSALEKLNIPGTMFMVGRQCADFPMLVQECSCAGHMVAVHGYTHTSFRWHLSRWQRESIQQTTKVIAESGAKCEPLFRPPHGRFNPLTSRVLSELGFAGVLWTQIADDWLRQNSARLEAKLLNGLEDGSIIVLHDRPQTIENVVRVLPRLADEVRRRGWQFTTLTDPLHSVSFSL